jgi:hypothetical protein
MTAEDFSDEIEHDLYGSDDDPPKPKFVPVDLTEMMDEGVLMAANERFFWPLGLALTWDVPEQGAAAREAAGEPFGPASNLHVREWQWKDERHEGIAVADDDPVMLRRRARFEKWWLARIASMPAAERRRAVIAVSRP